MICGGRVYLNFAGLGEENELLVRAAHGGNCDWLRHRAPFRRTPLGFDTLDHILDVVVSRDRCSWA